MTHIKSTLLLGVLCLTVASLAPAQTVLLFKADAKTVTVKGADVLNSPIETRLFMDSSFATPAPLNTAIWFIADLNKDGLLAQSVGSSQVPLDKFLGTDDVVLFQDVVDGNQPGSVAGRYRQQGIEVNGPAASLSLYQNANIYACLWNVTGTGFTPAANDTFGLMNLGVNPPPAIGNAFWAIDQNMNAAQFTLIDVPEPATYGVASGLLLAAFACLRRTRGRSDN